MRSAGNQLAYSYRQWLGLHLLTALGQIIPFPYPPPYAELKAISAHVSPEK